MHTVTDTPCYGVVGSTSQGAQHAGSAGSGTRHLLRSCGSGQHLEMVSNLGADLRPPYSVTSCSHLLYIFVHSHSTLIPSYPRTDPAVSAHEHERSSLQSLSPDAVAWPRRPAQGPGGAVTAPPFSSPTASFLTDAYKLTLTHRLIDILMSSRLYELELERGEREERCRRPPFARPRLLGRLLLAGISVTTLWCLWTFVGDTVEPLPPPPPPPPSPPSFAFNPPPNPAYASAFEEDTLRHRGFPSGVFTPMVVRDCTHLTPAWFAPCVALRTPIADRVYGEELVYPDFGLPEPLFAQPEHAERWRAGLGSIADRAVLANGFVMYKSQHGQNFVRIRWGWLTAGRKQRHVHPRRIRGHVERARVHGPQHALGRPQADPRRQRQRHGARRELARLVVVPALARPRRARGRAERPPDATQRNRAHGQAGKRAGGSSLGPHRVRRCGAQAQCAGRIRRPRVLVQSRAHPPLPLLARPGTHAPPLHRGDSSTAASLQDDGEPLQWHS